MDLIKKLTGKDPSEYEKVAKSLVDNSDTALFAKLVKQDDFLNIVVALDTNLTPLELLHWLQIIEKSLHRRRLIHWGPRTIDLDIVLYEDEEWQTANLKIPHPEMGNRRFVLQPLLDVMDDDPAHQAWIKRLLQNTTDHNWIRPVE